MNYQMKYLIKLFLLFITCFTVQAQDFPKKPDSPRAVNDFANFFSSEEQARLEQTFRNYYDTTSTAIVVVVVPSLNGYEVNDYATRLFNNWGIGGSKENNGVLILLKPKTQQERGQAYILAGYGMEGIIPDATTNRIVDNEMIPRLQNGQNYEAVNAAASTIFNLAKGSFTADQYMKKTGNTKKKPSGTFIIIAIVLFVLIISGMGRKGGGKNLSSRGQLPLWILMSLLSSGGGGRGSFGGFSSGGGGFGGFGGGRSGGGGAGGSW